MQRDKKLIKQILLHVRQHANGDPIPFPSFEGYEQRLVNYHVTLCAEAGFIALKRGVESGLMDAVDEISHLTWQGHEQLEKWPCR